MGKKTIKKLRKAIDKQKRARYNVVAKRNERCERNDQHRADKKSNARAEFNANGCCSCPWGKKTNGKSEDKQSERHFAG